MTDTTKAAALAETLRASDDVRTKLAGPPLGFYLLGFADCRDQAAALLRTQAARIEALDLDRQAIEKALMHKLEPVFSERDTMRARIAELEANGVHSCHPECTRPVCVLQRRVAELEAERAGLVAAERERCAKLCEFWDATHPKRLAEEIRRVGAA